MSIAILKHRMPKEMSFSERECVKLGTLQSCSLKDPRDLGDFDTILVQFKDLVLKILFKKYIYRKVRVANKYE